MTTSALSACVMALDEARCGLVTTGGHFVVARTAAPGAFPTELGDSVVLFVEEREPGPSGQARARSFASWNGGVSVVFIVPEGLEARHERALLDAGLFAVIEDGAGIERSLARLAAAVRRLVSFRAETARLVSQRAHNDRLRAVGLLAAGIGHEINNPNQAVLANLESVRDEIDEVISSPRAQRDEWLASRAQSWSEALGDSIAACRRVASIVRTLGAFSRPSAPPRPLEHTDLNDEVMAVLRMIGSELKNEVFLVLQLAPQLPPVAAPAHAMTQVITNLLINAFQALQSVERGARRLTIRTTHDTEVVCAEIVDTGPGMPPEVLARIFEPFFTTKPVGEGTGLGLAIARDLTVSAGGEVFVESEVGVGTSFRLVLPRAEAQIERRRPVSGPPPPIGRARVLLVDDDELLLRALKRALGTEFDCVAVASGADALRVLAGAAQFDVLVSDVVMPDMNGLELHAAVSDVDPLLARRYVFLSGGLREGALLDGIGRTGCTLLEKPISPSELARRIREVSSRR